ncbi:hypothetical protein HKCCE3408_17570 [Rhodobacterales bacterium HKCCE3408]|nr:hypothetical protein [Rhodobacterales bacterium HKCCE3408]
MRLRPDTALLIALGAAAVVGGLFWGRASLPPTETEAIAAVARDYVAETGGEMTDCLARPGPPPAWITVYCDGEAGRFAYPLGRDGRPVEVAEDGA